MVLNSCRLFLEISLDSLYTLFSCCLYNNVVFLISVFVFVFFFFFDPLILLGRFTEQVDCTSFYFAQVFLCKYTLHKIQRMKLHVIVSPEFVLRMRS